MNYDNQLEPRACAKGLNNPQYAEIYNWCPTKNKYKVSLCHDNTLIFTPGLIQPNYLA